MRTSQTTHGLNRLPGDANPFDALIVDWRATAAGSAARRAIATWSETSPVLAGFASPADVVDTINRAGDPARSCLLLSELLAIAIDDELATRAVLQAIIPGLRRAVRHRWSRAATDGPWRSEHELAADAISTAWHAIRIHCGQRHQRPAGLIIRRVEGSLRQEHRRWRRELATVIPLSEVPETSVPQDGAYSAEERSVRVIADATRTGVIDHTDAALLLAVGVAGHTTIEAATALKIASPFSAARRIRNARVAIRRRADIVGRRNDNPTLASGQCGPTLRVHDRSPSQRARP